MYCRASVAKTYYSLLDRASVVRMNMNHLFQDDIMDSQRIDMQYEAALSNKDAVNL